MSTHSNNFKYFFLIVAIWALFGPETAAVSLRVMLRPSPPPPQKKKKKIKKKQKNKKKKTKKNKKNNKN